MFRRKSTTTARRATVGSGDNPGGSLKAQKLDSKKRSKSVPTSLSKMRHIKGIMKFVTEDDSLHSKYGSEGKGSEGKEASDTSKDTSSDEARRVTLKDIQIREYSRTIGDNPSCSSGPPVSIAWDYDPETKIVSVDQYEDTRPPRRTHFEMVLPRDVRQNMLKKEWDVSQGQIAAAVRANIKIKNQRRATVNNLGKATRVEEAMESAGRKVFRGLLLKKSTDQQVKELEKQHQAAEKKRQSQAMLSDKNDDDDDFGPEDDEHEDTMDTVNDAVNEV